MNYSIPNIASILILALIFPQATFAAEPNSNINLTITNIRNDRGQILLSVFNQAEGFPSDSTKTYRTYILEAQTPSLSLLIEDLIPGEYAIALVHDENSNLKLDTNLVGAPVEGYAASGVNKRFSAPRYSSSKFLLKKETLILEIEMKYLF
jgi:uncharacterized protein (DUF2141 family)